MNKLFLTLLAAACIAPAAFADDEKPKEKADSAKFEFTDVKTIKTTSVKDQNKTGTCWCFAGTAFYENEIWKASGDSLDISEMFTVRQCYLDKAKRYARMQGATNFAQGGSVLDVPYVWDNYGAVPEEVYAGLNYGEKKHDHQEMAGVLRSFMNSISNSRKLSSAWLTAFEGILDAYFGKVPEKFDYKGKTYTPKSYAKSLGLSTDDYIAVTSWTHHPFYSPFILEIPDNWVWGEYQNVTIDELKAIADNAIENGYSFVWAADVSEPGWKWKEGFAVMPKEKTEADLEGTELARWVKLTDKEREQEKYSFNYPIEEIEVTQEQRQKWFDSMETTDDHGMVIMGIAKDQDGKLYYKVKNSWDSNQIYDGYIYVSEPYFRAKTISIYVNKKAIPKDIAKKFK
ncbi:MAG: aminopeptidase [Muribaculaceae bacterium]|nr:aminopeptidase [Muribaculaceae bacterium]